MNNLWKFCIIFLAWYTEDHVVKGIPQNYSSIPNVNPGLSFQNYDVNVGNITTVDLDPIFKSQIKRVKVNGTYFPDIKTIDYKNFWIAIVEESKVFINIDKQFGLEFTTDQHSIVNVQLMLPDKTELGSENNNLTTTNLTALLEMKMLEPPIFTYDYEELLTTFPDLQKHNVLYLDYNKLTDFPTDFVLAFENLKVLSLRHNNLTVLDKYFDVMSTLTVLDLSFNQLAEIKPPALDSLNNLRVLDLHNNEISCIRHQQFSGLPSLKNLFLQNNRISRLEWDAFEPLKSLETLNIGFNNLHTLPDNIFDHLPKLAELRIAKTEITTFKPLLLKALRALKTLDLSNNALLRYLDNAIFFYTPRLQNLDLSGTGLKYMPTSLSSLNVTRFHVLRVPLQCDCNNQWMAIWSKEHGIMLNEYCLNSTSGSNKILTEFLSTTDCPPKIPYITPISFRQVGESVVLQCLPFTHPKSEITWEIPTGIKLKKNDKHRGVSVNGLNELIIPSLELLDSGNFECHAENAFGKTSEVTGIYIQPRAYGSLFNGFSTMVFLVSSIAICVLALSVLYALTVTYVRILKGADGCEEIAKCRFYQYFGRFINYLEKVAKNTLPEGYMQLNFLKSRQLDLKLLMDMVIHCYCRFHQRIVRSNVYSMKLRVREKLTHLITDFKHQLKRVKGKAERERIVAEYEIEANKLLEEAIAFCDQNWGLYKSKHNLRENYTGMFSLTEKFAYLSCPLMHELRDMEVFSKQLVDFMEEEVEYEEEQIEYFMEHTKELVKSWCDKKLLVEACKPGADFFSLFNPEVAAKGIPTI